MSLLREIRLMKYLVVVLTLIFSMTGSVNADDHNTRWVLLMSEHLGPADENLAYDRNGGFVQKITQTSDDYKNQTYRDESDCHQGLKSIALEKNTDKQNYKGESAFKIEVVDDFRFQAKARRYEIHFSQIHCVQITLD